MVIPAPSPQLNGITPVRGTRRERPRMRLPRGYVPQMAVDEPSVDDEDADMMTNHSGDNGPVESSNVDEEDQEFMEGVGGSMRNEMMMAKDTNDLRADPSINVTMGMPVDDNANDEVVDDGDTEEIEDSDSEDTTDAEMRAVEARMNALYPNRGFAFPLLSRVRANQVAVGGFFIPREYHDMYTRIWNEFGHIASEGANRALTEGFVGVLLERIAEMREYSMRRVEPEMLLDWEDAIAAAESQSFNVTWLRERFEQRKRSKAQADVVTDDALAMKEKEVAEQEVRFKEERDVLYEMRDVRRKAGAIVLSGLF